ncbi:MAG: hypothetical protein ACI8WA_000541 [Polaribacter sp.]|jgi:hypothetical protein
MHKKLAADLTSIAHSILQLKNKEDVLVLKEKAYEVYEKLTVLAYVDEYINTTPNATETKEELLDKIENIVKEKVDVVIEKDQPEEEVVDEKEVEIKAEEINEFKEEEELVEDEIEVEDFSIQPEVTENNEVVEEETIVVEFDVKEELVEKIVEQPFDELEQVLFSSENTTEETLAKDKKTITLEEELHDTISVEVAADLFEKLDLKKSLNDQLQQNIQIGLNDRIVFVKNLFNGSQEEFNRVVSQINTLKTEKEARKFINKMVKPDYDWSKQEEFEERFMVIIERKFA